MGSWIKFPVGASAKFKILFTNPEGKEKEYQGKTYLQYNYCVEIVEDNGLELKPNTSEYSYWSTSQKNNDVVVHNNIHKGDIIKVTRPDSKIYIIQDANGDILTDIPKPQKQEPKDDGIVPYSQHQQQSTPTEAYKNKEVIPLAEKPRDYAMMFKLAIRSVMDAHLEFGMEDTPCEEMTARINTVFIGINAAWSGKFLNSQQDIERMWSGEEPELETQPDAKLIHCPECKSNVDSGAYNNKLGMCVVCAKKAINETVEEPVEIHPQSTANDDLPF